jgi:hypothetical protein
MTSEIPIVVNRHAGATVNTNGRRLAVQTLQAGNGVTGPEAFLSTLVINVSKNANGVLPASSIALPAELRGRARRQGRAETDQNSKCKNPNTTHIKLLLQIDGRIAKREQNYISRPRKEKSPRSRPYPL